MYTTQGAEPTSEKQRNLEEKNMISYAEAKRRAQAAKPNWNEDEYIAKAIIFWADDEYEYDLEIENKGDSDDEFTAWIEEHAEELAKKAAAEQGTTFDELLHISYETDYYDDDADFDAEYENWCEFEWECSAGR